MTPEIYQKLIALFLLCQLCVHEIDLPGA